jgi:hypothetical protein
MNINALKKILTDKSSRWIVAVILLGVLGAVLLMDGFNLVGSSGVTASSGSTDLEARLAGILSSISGAGKVRVMVYENKNEVKSAWLSSDTQSTNSNVIGVVVVSEGAQDIRVQLELIRAVQTLLDIPASAVEVFAGGL